MSRLLVRLSPGPVLPALLGAAVIAAGPAPVSAQALKAAAVRSLDLGLAGDSTAWSRPAAEQGELQGQWSALPDRTVTGAGIQPMVKLHLTPHGDSRDDQKAIFGVTIPIRPTPPG